jgi:hypothetical protein
MLFCLALSFFCWIQYLCEHNLFEIIFIVHARLKNIWVLVFSTCCLFHCSIWNKIQPIIIIVHVRLLNHSFVNIFLFNPINFLWVPLNLLFTYVWKPINLIWQIFFLIITILCIVIYCLFLSCRNLDMGIFIKGWRLGFQFLGFSTHLEH